MAKKETVKKFAISTSFLGGKHNVIVSGRTTPQIEARRKLHRRKLRQDMGRQGIADANLH
jgi:hypothetical protein